MASQPTTPSAVPKEVSHLSLPTADFAPPATSDPRYGKAGVMIGIKCIRSCGLASAPAVIPVGQPQWTAAVSGEITYDPVGEPWVTAQPLKCWSFRWSELVTRNTKWMIINLDRSTTTNERREWWGHVLIKGWGTALGWGTGWIKWWLFKVTVKAEKQFKATTKHHGAHWRQNEFWPPIRCAFATNSPPKLSTGRNNEKNKDWKTTTATSSAWTAKP